MPAGNACNLYFHLQNAKGTPATFGATGYKLNVSDDADVGVNVETNIREETNASRDRGEEYIQVLGVEGGAQVYLRPKSAALLLYGALGAKAAVASAPGTKHTLTPSNDQPYFTVIREYPGFLIEQFNDCKITGMNVEWEAGSELQATLGIAGLGYERLASIPAGSPTFDNGAPFKMPGMVPTIESVIEDTHTEGNLNIQGEQTPIQTTGIFYTYLEPAQRVVEYSYEEIMVAIARYAKLLTGSATGTSLSANIYTGTVRFAFGTLSGAGPGLQFDIPRAIFRPSEVAPNTDGDPLRLPVGGVAATPIGGGNIMSADVYNDVSSYTGT